MDNLDIYPLMTYPRVIGLTGYAGSGKDLVGALLSMRGFKRIAFADPLRAEVAELLRSGDPAPSKLDDDLQDVINSRFVTVEQLYAKPTSDVVRAILQQWGTEHRRGQDLDYWIKIADDRVKILGNDPIVVTDVRFQNEVDWVHSLGGEVWRINRPSTGGMDHVSEALDALTGVDRLIENNWTAYELASLVLSALG